MLTLLLASLLVVQTATNGPAQTSQPAPNQSTVAPAFRLKNLNGRNVQLSDYKGRVVLINLWASWCAPCLVEMPELVKLQKEHESRGLQIIGVTYPDDSRTSIRRKARQFKLNYPVLFGTSDFMDEYQIGEVLPVTVVVDRDGNIRDRILGILEPEEFREKVAPLLGSADGRQPAVRSLNTPAGPGSGEPNLFTASDGRVFLTWIESTESKAHRLRFAVRDGGNWSDPRTIAEGSNWVVNWADFPSLIVLKDGSIVAHWLVKAGSAHAYDINISRSTDRGSTWSKPILPHRDGTRTEHGFVSMLPWAGGRAAAVWLDGRNFKEGSTDGHGSSANEMTLRFTTIDASGRFFEDALLDARVCDCCQTSAALTSEGAIVAYRDRSEKEIRDISIVRFYKGRWTEPRSLGADNWEINGCPVNGPSVSAAGRRVAVAWFTAAKDAPRVNVIFSGDAGATFSQPIRVDDGAPVGRVDVQMLPDGSAVVCWLEKTERGGEVRIRRVSPDGSRDQTVTVAESGVARASGFPQMALSGNEVIFAWTDPGVPSRVRTAAIRIDAAK